MEAVESVEGLAAKVSGNKAAGEAFKRIAEGQYRAWQLRKDLPAFPESMAILQKLDLVSTYTSPEGKRNEVVFLTRLGNAVMKRLYGADQNSLFERDSSRDPRSLIDLVVQYFTDLGFELRRRSDAAGRFLFVSGYARIHAFVASGRGTLADKTTRILEPDVNAVNVVTATTLAGDLVVQEMHRSFKFEHGETKNLTVYLSNFNRVRRFIDDIKARSNRGSHRQGGDQGGPRHPFWYFQLGVREPQGARLSEFDLEQKISEYHYKARLGFKAAFQALGRRDHVAFFKEGNAAELNAIKGRFAELWEKDPDTTTFTHLWTFVAQQDPIPGLKDSIKVRDLKNKVLGMDATGASVTSAYKPTEEEVDMAKEHYGAVDELLIPYVPTIAGRTIGRGEADSLSAGHFSKAVDSWSKAIPAHAASKWVEFILFANAALEQALSAHYVVGLDRQASGVTFRDMYLIAGSRPGLDLPPYREGIEFRKYRNIASHDPAARLPASRMQKALGFYERAVGSLIAGNVPPHERFMGDARRLSLKDLYVNEQKLAMTLQGKAAILAEKARPGNVKPWNRYRYRGYEPKHHDPYYSKGDTAVLLRGGVSWFDAFSNRVTKELRKEVGADEASLGPRGFRFLEAGTRAGMRIPAFRVANDVYLGNARIVRSPSVNAGTLVFGLALMAAMALVMYLAASNVSPGPGSKINGGMVVLAVAAGFFELVGVLTALVYSHPAPRKVRRHAGALVEAIKREAAIAEITRQNAVQVVSPSGDEFEDEAKTIKDVPSLNQEASRSKVEAAKSLNSGYYERAVLQMQAALDNKVMAHHLTKFGFLPGRSSLIRLINNLVATGMFTRPGVKKVMGYGPKGNPYIRWTKTEVFVPRFDAIKQNTVLRNEVAHAGRTVTQKEASEMARYFGTFYAILDQGIPSLPDEGDDDDFSYLY
ncbi:MAG: hypothetical protein JW839_03455 [Candidatus Lokiarchaeota archaeon]|nr:hypothetical protein [Candidatus Lokiarchaeota archaeon]